MENKLKSFQIYASKHTVEDLPQLAHIVIEYNGSRFTRDDMVKIKDLLYEFIEKRENSNG